MCKIERVFDESIELKDNAMLKVRPELFNEWDFEQNDRLSLDAYKMTKGQNKIAWWQCPKCKSSYDMVISTRAGKQKQDCPYCAGRRVNQTNSLFSIKPFIAIEWHPDLNGNLSAKDITSGSGKLIWWLCPDCKSSYDMNINTRTSLFQNCPYCAGHRVNHTNSLVTLHPELAKEWHPTLNSELTPHDVTYGSERKAWWLGKCQHFWHAEICSRSGLNSGCPYCSGHKILKGFNDMWSTNPELASQLADSEDGYKYTQSSHTKVNWKCLECREIIKNKKINMIKIQGLSCPRCSDGISFSEKFMYNLLKEAGIEFISEKTFEWSKKKRYDFYLPEYGYIIETHGEQHYINPFSTNQSARTLKEEQENDRFKEKLAKENGIDKYVIVDCRYPTVKRIKENILNSDIVKIINEEDIDFEKIGQLASKTLVKVACDLWMSGISHLPQIATTLNISHGTVAKYLKRGAEIGWCDYRASNQRKIVQLEKDGLLIRRWDSIKEASDELNIARSGISASCMGRYNHSGGYKWMYEEDHGINH